MADEEKAIAGLRADEAVLTRPERIGGIAQQQLGLAPANPSQYTAAEALKQRLGEERTRLPAPGQPPATLAPSPDPVTAATVMRAFAAPYEDVWGPRRARIIAGVLALVFVVIVGRSAYVAFNGPDQRGAAGREGRSRAARRHRRPQGRAAGDDGAGQVAGSRSERDLGFARSRGRHPLGVSGAAAKMR